MENKNLTEINDDLLNAINKELNKKYQRGIISVNISLFFYSDSSS